MGPEFSITFMLTNAAFEEDPGTEIETVLLTTARKIHPGGSGPVRDRNGNTIGEWRWTV